MTARRLLVVSYNHPPFPGPGGNRWVTMSRYLRERGHDVTILASGAFGGLPDDDELRVLRVNDLKSSRMLRRLLRRGEIGEHLAAGTSDGVERPAPALLTKVLVPDSYTVSVVPAMIRAVRRVIASRRIDCLVTSGPPESMHLVGLALRGRRRPPWLVDMRDGWSFESTRAFPTSPQRRLDAALERRVLAGADAVTAVTAPIAEDARRRFGIDVALVPNGFDPDAEIALSADDIPSLPDGRRCIVHTGMLSGPRGRSAEALFNALMRLASEPAVASKICFVQVGSITPRDSAVLADLRAHDLARALGIVPAPVARALQRRADALLLITSSDVSQATAKLYDYLAAGRPIIALAEGNEAARIVGETRTGVTISPKDVEGIVAALRRVATGDLERAFDPRGIECFAYPAPADAMADSVETAIRRRARNA